MIKKLRVFLEMIKVEHTLFALPFAAMGAYLGSVLLVHQLPTCKQISFIFVAMFGARSAAFGLNRLIDHAIDAKNPRTMTRALPIGLLHKKEVVVFIIICFSLLFWSAAQLHERCVQLLPLAVFMLVFYSYTKRFTYFCHLILGATIGLAPLGSWIAVTGVVNATALVLYVAMAFWIAGFDIIYACQDMESDRQAGLYSIPAQFGLVKALWVAKGCHFCTVIGLLLLLFLTPLGTFYICGFCITCGLLFYEHYIVSPHDMTRLQTAFFQLNSILSIVLCFFTIVDLVMK